VSISIESRREVTWRSNVENWLYDVKYTKSQPLKSQCQSKIKCSNPHKVKGNEVVRINIVQTQVEKMYFIFNLEYRNVALSREITHGLPTKSQWSQSLKTQVRWVKNNGLIHSTSHKTLDKPYVPVSKSEGPVCPVVTIFWILDVPIPKPDVSISTS
jgi:hypothetical protein